MPSVCKLAYRRMLRRKGTQAEEGWALDLQEKAPVEMVPTKGATVQQG